MMPGRARAVQGAASPLPPRRPARLWHRGRCELRAAPGVLEMTLTARDDEALRRLEDVVARHLARFAWREPPTVTWQAGA